MNSRDPKLDKDARSQLTELVRSDDDLVPINKDEFLPGLPLPTDVFIRMPNGKHILIAKRGVKSSLQDLHVSQSDSVDTFFVRREDYFNAVDQNLKIAGILVQRREIPIGKKAAFLRTAAASVFAELEHLGLSPTSFSHAKVSVQAVVTMVQSRDEYIELVDSIKGIPGNIIKYAVAGAALSVVIAKEMGWQNQGNLEKLALCAFLRDVGMKDIPQAIAEKSSKHMTTDERGVWETHCMLGAEILRGLNEMPSDVIAVALEHHENAIGQGFPRKLRDIKMNPFAKVVALADIFLELTMPKSASEPAMDYHIAVQHIEFAMGSPYNKACLVALKRAFNIAAPAAAPTPSKPVAAASTSTAEKSPGTVPEPPASSKPKV